jgi:G3E family GTPase
MTDRGLTGSCRIDNVVTVVDAMHGEVTLDRHIEARRQVALADRLVMSKTDLSDAAGAHARSMALNPGADIAIAADVTPDMLFAPVDPATRALRMTRLPDLPAASPFATGRHTDGIETFALRRDTPLPALALTLLLQALTEHCGDRLLRVKGLVDIAEMPGQPAVIHGVQHVFAEPVFLDAWPSDDRSTRIVFIVRGVPRHFPARLLAAIEEEVRDAGQ